MGANETDLAWFRFYGRRWLHGTMMLSPADRGIYIGVICLIVENGGPIEADDAYISKHLGVSPRTWRASRDRLVAAGKLTTFIEHSRTFHGNHRAESEAKHSRNSSEQQRQKIAKRWSKRLKPHDTEDTAVSTMVCTAVYTETIPGEEKRRDNPLPLPDIETASAPASPSALGTRSAGAHQASTKNVAAGGYPFPTPGRRADGTNPRTNGTDLRSRGSNPRAVRDAGEQQRIEDVDPDHQARVAAWAVSLGMDIGTVSQTDIQRARELGMLPNEP